MGRGWDGVNQIFLFVWFLGGGGGGFLYGYMYGDGMRCVSGGKLSSAIRLPMYVCRN